jgi:SAM-dependent methyltransferase
MQCVICSCELRTIAKYNYKSEQFRRIYTGQHVYQCIKCGLKQVDNSRVDNLALTKYYAHDYRNVAKIAVADTEGQHVYYKARGHALAALVASVPARAFELGPGYGYNLQGLRERFPSVQLFTDEIDVSLSAKLTAQRASLCDGGYDTIILSHVLEHFTNPVDLLKQAKAALNVGGTLVIEVPNDPFGIYPLNGPDEPHLTFFTDDTLRKCLEIAGLPIVDLFAAGPDMRRKSLKNFLKPLIRNALTATPIIKGLMHKRSASIQGKVDMARRNPNGIVLRAVVGGQ